MSAEYSLCHIVSIVPPLLETNWYAVPEIIMLYVNSGVKWVSFCHIDVFIHQFVGLSAIPRS
jgi:hypothetical protein